jgi:hypothetical protein
MKVKQLLSICLLCALSAHVAQAAPTLSVSPVVSGTNIDWHVFVSPDPALLPGSIAVALAFAIDDAELSGVAVNTVAWDLALPGFNPFTGTTTNGLWLDLIGDRTFGAFGSVVFSSSSPVELFNITTAGLPATLRWGVAASGSNSLGARLSQGGQNFDGHTGSLTVVPEPGSFALGIIGLLAMSLGWLRRFR